MEPWAFEARGQQDEKGPTKNTDKRWGGVSREFEEKPAECGIQKSSEEFLRRGRKKLGQTLLIVQVNNRRVTGDICKSSCGVAVRQKLK